MRLKLCLLLLGKITSYELAAEQGHPFAQSKMGYFYEKGIIVGKDLERAKWYFSQCSYNGTPLCQFNFGVLLAKSHSRQDLTQAWGWLTLAGPHYAKASKLIESIESILTIEEIENAKIMYAETKNLIKRTENFAYIHQNT